MNEKQWSVFEKQEQIGQLVISQVHLSRIQTYVWLLPLGEQAKWDSTGTVIENNGVLIYGQKSRSRHGWLRKGPWIKDLECEANRRLVVKAARIARVSQQRREFELSVMGNYKGL